MFGVKLEVACSLLCSHEFVIKDYRYFERYRKIYQHFIRHQCTTPFVKMKPYPSKSVMTFEDLTRRSVYKVYNVYCTTNGASSDRFTTKNLTYFTSE